MEAALLSGVLKIAGDKLAPLIVNEFTSIMGVKKDLSELQHLFEEITRRLSRDSDPSFYWLKDLKDVAYDFDDLLNKVHLEAEKHKAGLDGGNHVMANWFCAKPKSALSRLEMAREIQKIKKRFAKIVKQRTDINAIATSSVVEHPIQRTNKIIGEISVLENKDETEVLGRDKVRREIICKLAEADTQEKISIVSIVGLGGSGKTTLAKYICQDSKIKEHFEVTFWVHVSQEFDVEKLIRKLFESVADNKLEVDSLQHMIEKISEKLSGKKFLLVLDDVWNENPHDWEQFEQRFKSGATGSKILLTTRGRKVAEVVKSKEIVNLSSLSDDESWKLFQQSSGWAEERLDTEFIDVGKEIVRKCAGVPLAIKSLAGVLSDKREIREWQTLKDSSLLDEFDIGDRVFGSLKLSYLQLSDDLKQCFVLCSIFPKGSCMYKDHLTSQWRAHGFVNPVNGSRQPEDIASDFFDSLLKVSFLQDLVEEEDTGRLSCKMHDLVHDLSRQILQDELVLTPQKITADHDQRCRFLSLASCTEKIDRKLFKKVRALYVTGGSFTTDKPIKKGGCVCSVILEDLTNASFPMFALKFEYLGYLRISHVGCTELPEAITDCWNLQALYIISCYRFAMLPESIGKLKRLRTLELSWVDRLESLPQSIGDCNSLESLHLRNCGAFKQIPDSIAKNEKLRVLDIVKCSSLCQLPSESFKMLKSINIILCESLKQLPGTLASNELHTLKLCGVSKLTILPPCITSLNSLKHLDLGGCCELAELPEGIVNLQRLEVLNLKGCHKLSGMPAGFGQLSRLRKLGLFVIGDSSEHAGIAELGNLDMLSGVLEIKGIMYLNDPGDAEKAYLKKKKNIQKLVLNWYSIGTDAEEEVDMEQEPTESDVEEEVDMEQEPTESDVEEEVGMEQELAVLNGLKPPSGIKKLKILGYQGLHLPCWMTKERHSSHLDSEFKQTVDLPYFPHLSKMVLHCFLRLKHLSGPVGFPSLETLKLSEFGALESITTGPFPSLTELWISGMPHLLELSTKTRIALADEDGVVVCGDQESQCCFPRLSTLHIEMCPQLNVRPWFLPSLESLTLERSNEQLLFSDGFFRSVHPHGDDEASSSLSLLKKLVLTMMTGPSGCSGWELLRLLTALESLEILSCDELRQLPESMQSLTSLQRLDITGCSGLHELPEWLGELRSLQILVILGCENLREFPEGIQHLTSLQSLLIESCDALQQLPEGLGGLLSLRSLEIKDLPNLSCLPESMRGLTSLQRLQIGNCDSLHRLPDQLGELRSLQNLDIHECHALQQLPGGLGGLLSLRSLWIEDLPNLSCLPESMRGLLSLRGLWIENLPNLSCLPESMRGLTSLQQLHIINCASLHRLPDQLGELRSLQNLEISCLPALTCLPESMQRLTSLHRLCIGYCDALTALPEWIGQLSALQSLQIWGCRGLTSLPSSIRRLATLQTLQICDNPDLARRCKQGEGEDWRLISHIPIVRIG